MTERRKLAKSSYLMDSNPSNLMGDIPEHRTVPGLVLPSQQLSRPRTHADYLLELDQCRYFYKYDPIASSVVNRITELAITPIQNRRGKTNDLETKFFNYVARGMTKMLQVAAREFLVGGYALPSYTIERVMANRIDPSLGRVRINVPGSYWVRNQEFIELKRSPVSINRRAYIKITDAERQFILSGGEYPDGTKDTKAYESFARAFPEYVQAVKNSTDALIPLPNAHVIMRKPMSYDDYPQPYLVPALGALRHKLRIKQMDYSIATRALEAIRHIKVGNDEFPVEEGDTALDDLENKIAARQSVSREVIYSLFTNHTVEIDWIYPPLDALLSDGKYSEPNSDIFLALGFSRTLLVGESLRSNASQNVSASLGPIATINEMREGLLEWIRILYEDMAEQNGFRNIATPYFRPISSADLSTLMAFAVEAARMGAISQDTIANAFGTTYEFEKEQRDTEDPIEPDTPAAQPGV